MSNAGGSRAPARRRSTVAADLGRAVRVAVVDGGDARVVRRAATTVDRCPPGRRHPFDELSIKVDVTSASLECWGIAEVLQEGADIVVTGQVATRR